VKNSLLSDLAVVYEPVSALKPSSRNARVHSKRQIDQIAESIKAFGFTNPILIDRTNTIVAGHGRVAAAKLLGMDQVPTIRLETLTEAQVRAYVIADNRLAEKAVWDKSILAIELQCLMTIDNLDVTVTGFEVAEIDLAVHEGTGKRDQDDIFGLPESGQTVAKSGDIWWLGPHRIVCGDSLDAGSYAAVDVAIRRWQKCTRDRAIHAVTGKCFDDVDSTSGVDHD
jgi:ParB-like chromosome segregation protein Spo0J